MISCLSDFSVPSLAGYFGADAAPDEIRGAATLLAVPRNVELQEPPYRSRAFFYLFRDDGKGLETGLGGGTDQGHAPE